MWHDLILNFQYSQTYYNNRNWRWKWWHCLKKYGRHIYRCLTQSNKLEVAVLERGLYPPCCCKAADMTRRSVLRTPSSRTCRSPCYRGQVEPNNFVFNIWWGWIIKWYSWMWTFKINVDHIVNKHLWEVFVKNAMETCIVLMGINIQDMFICLYNLQTYFIFTCLYGKTLLIKKNLVLLKWRVIFSN